MVPLPAEGEAETVCVSKYALVYEVVANEIVRGTTTDTVFEAEEAVKVKAEVLA